MNIKNSFLVAASLLVLGACARHPGESVRRGTLYNNETNIDSEAFTFFKRVHEKALFETAFAKYIQSIPASTEAKGLAAKVAETYEPIIAELAGFASEYSVVLTERTEPDFVVPHHFETDSLRTFDNAGYVAHVQHEQGAILEQFERLTRNTNKELQEYALEKVSTVKAVFAAAGGQEDHGAHH